MSKKYQKGIEAALRAANTNGTRAGAVLDYGATMLRGDVRLGWLCGMALVAASRDRRWTPDGARLAILGLQMRRARRRAA